MKILNKLAAVGVFSLMVVGTASAQTRQPAPAAAAQPAGSTDEKPDDACGRAGDDFFCKLNWGAGLGYVLDFEGKQRVGEAELVNGIVRISDEDDAKVGIMVETHVFFEPAFGSRQLNVRAGEWGVGPFVAAQLGNEDLIETVALGLMFGRRRGENGSFNLGIGVAVDPNARVLGDGLEANAPLPAGETVLRYKEEAQYGLIIMTSFSW